MKPEIVKDEPIPGQPRSTLGRGNLKFPEFLELGISRDGTKGDCLIYPDSPHNRKALIMAKCNYNRRDEGSFAGMQFSHRYEVRHGDPVIVIQRIV